MHEGHRQRMMQRLENQPDGLQDHELLEILLFNAIPRKNTNEIAHALLDAFGTLSAVFSAHLDELVKVAGVGRGTASYIKCVGALLARVAPAEDNRSVVYNSAQFGAELVKRYRNLSAEVVEIYCLDVHSAIRSSRRFSTGNSDKVLMQPEEESSFIISQNPRGVVLAHNHLGQSNLPSDADDRFTAQIQLLCSMNNIRLVDHLIVSKSGAYSYFLSGRLETIKSQFNVNTVIRKGII